VFFRIGASVMSAALGESVRSRKIIAAEALERAEQAERSREERARALVDEERLRIAREVHDTVAHAVAIINVQSGVAAHVLDKRPERTRHTLEVIEQTSSRALQEMRTILGVLHDDGGARTPPAGLGQLDELTEQAREAGLEVDLETTVPPPHIPDAVGRAVYRILQESITNVIRHVGRSRVAIAVTYGVDTVDVRVTDDGGRVDDGRVASEILGAGGRAAPDGAVVSDDGGRGIAGMRERCRLLGGDLRAGPVAGGGFAVDARIPVMPGRTAAL
jgi:signal transduction histidine kinase